MEFAGILMLIMGVGIVAVALQGIVRGWLPNGPKGYRQGTGVYRDKQPVAFWTFFALYVGMGAYAVIYALRLLFGGAEP